MNYATEVVEKEDGFFWGVMEKNTDQMIKIFFFKDEAERFARKLNRGAGFDGFTPAFMIKEMPKTNLNDDFEALLDEV